MAVPSAAAAAVSVSLLHLEDWGCVSHRNDTHLVVSGPLTQCGTSRRQTGEYVNTVCYVAGMVTGSIFLRLVGYLLVPYLHGDVEFDTWVRGATPDLVGHAEA